MERAGVFPETVQGPADKKRGKQADFAEGTGKSDGQEQEPQMNNALRIAMAMAFLATLGLSGCGKKGQLQKPADAPKEAPVGPDGKKPHRPFVLDRLL